MDVGVADAEAVVAATVEVACAVVPELKALDVRALDRVCETKVVFLGSAVPVPAEAVPTVPTPPIPPKGVVTGAVVILVMLALEFVAVMVVAAIAEVLLPLTKEKRPE